MSLDWKSIGLAANTKVSLRDVVEQSNMHGVRFVMEAGRVRLEGAVESHTCRRIPGLAA
jgi:hypothetical protein